MANVLNGYADLTFLHRYSKTQPTTTSTSPVITKYIPEINMLINLSISALHPKYLTCIYRRCMHLNVSHIRHVHLNKVHSLKIDFLHGSNETVFLEVVLIFKSFSDWTNLIRIGNVAACHWITVDFGIISKCYNTSQTREHTYYNKSWDIQ